jgi:hypothetical protein
MGRFCFTCVNGLGVHLSRMIFHMPIIKEQRPKEPNNYPRTRMTKPLNAHAIVVWVCFNIVVEKSVRFTT